MQEKPPTLWAIFAVLFMILGLFTAYSSLFYNLGKAAEKKAAVEAGVGYWEADPQTGVTTFKYKSLSNGNR